MIWLKPLVVTLFIAAGATNHRGDDGEPKAASTIACPNGLTAEATDWPWWRGPTLDGHARGPAPPTQWNETKNIRWRTKVPGRGHASPCVVGESVFIATAEGAEGETKTRKGITIVSASGKGEVQSLICYDRASGKQLWQTDLHHGGFLSRHAKNSHATPTPACDGERVYCVFANHDKVWLSAVGLAGEIVWQKEVGPITGRYGYGASPLLFQSLVVVNVDHPGGGAISAFDRKTGKRVWQSPRDKWYGFASPVAANLDGRPQILQSGVRQLTSYDPESGKVLWACPAPSNTLASTPVVGENRVFVTGGDPETGIHGIRVKSEGNGDRLQADLLWQNSTKVYVPSSLLIDGRLLAIKDLGVAVCFDAATGEKLWEERLGGEFSASPVVCDGLVFVPNEAGKMFVFRPTPKFERVAENDLADGGFASPVIANGSLYLRTLGWLYRIGDARQDTR